jgi:cyclophilin family peptidyl-prolyl cis-trans isomerase
MRTFFALLMLCAIGGGCWYGWETLNRPVETAQSEADNFADSALAAFYNATTSSSSNPTEEGTSSANPQATITKTAAAPIINNQNYMHATLHTSQGDITIEFFDKDAPNTVANFKKLAGSGFYDGTKFHRVIAGFMIQGGDPLTKDDSMQARWGTGGPGYSFNDEIRPDNHNVTGTISMANSGPNTNGSQFFINVADNSYLDMKHTTFGKVTSGMDIVDKIEHSPTDGNDRPVTPVVISSVTLSE